MVVTTRGRYLRRMASLETKSIQPNFSVNGSAQIPLIEAYDALALSGYPRIPCLLPLASGVLLLSYIGNYNVDGSQRYAVARRSTDKGKTWSAPIIAFDQGAASFGTTWAGGWATVQAADTPKTVLLWIMSGPNAWGASGMAGKTTRILTYGIAKSTDDGLTWSAPTDVTSQVNFFSPALFFFGAGKSITLTCTNNGSGKVRLTTSAAHNLHIGSTVQMSLAGWSVGGINGTAYGTVIDGTTIDFSAVAFSGSPTGGTAQLIYANSYIGTGHGIRLRSTGPHPNRLCFAVELHPACDNGSTAAFYGVSGIIYSDDNGATWTCVVGDETSNPTLMGYGAIEPTLCELEIDGHIGIWGRSSNTSARRWHCVWTGSGTVGGAPVIDDGTGGTSDLNVGNDPGGVIRVAPHTYLMSCPNNGKAVIVTSARQRASVWLGTEVNENITWRPITVDSGKCWYSDINAIDQNNIFMAYESGDIEDLSTNPPITQIKLRGGFSLAWLKSQTTANDRERFAFNELPTGRTAIIQPASLAKNIGSTIGVPGQYFGTPAYIAAPAGNGQTAIRLGTSDYVQLCDKDNCNLDPDPSVYDTGDFTIRINFKIESSGYGVLFASYSGVGSSNGAGTGGVTISVDSFGRPVFTLDDGVHNDQHFDGTHVNDGLWYRVTLRRITTTKKYSWVIYSATGTVLSTNTLADPTTVARGSLTNGVNKCIGRYGDSATGRMNQAFSVDLFEFVRNSTDAEPPFSYVAPVPDGWQYSAGSMLPFPTQDHSSPLSVFGANCKLHTLEGSGWTGRGKIGSLTDKMPDSPTTGWPSSGLLDYSATNDYGINVDPGSFVNDSLAGRCRLFTDSIGNGFNMQAALGSYDFVQNSRQFWIGCKFQAINPPNGAGIIVLLSTLGDGLGGSDGFVVYLNTRGGAPISWNLAIVMLNGGIAAVNDSSLKNGGVLPNIIEGHWYDFQITGPAVVNGGKLTYYVTDLTASGSLKSGNALSPLITPAAITSGATAFTGAGTGSAESKLGIGTDGNDSHHYTFAGLMKMVGMASRNATAAEIKALCNYVG